MHRPTKLTHFLQLAQLVATRGTCVRRKTGCVLVDKYGHVLATGYNGRAAGLTECYEVECEGARAPSGQQLDKCEAIHAEQNALLQCPDVMAIKEAYVTTAPCVHCVKLLMNTGCEHIYFIEDYPHSDESRRLWLSTNEGKKYVTDEGYRHWHYTPLD